MRLRGQQLVFASWADASDRPRPDGSRTGGCVITLATEKLFGHGQEDDVSGMVLLRNSTPPQVMSPKGSSSTGFWSTHKIK